MALSNFGKSALRVTKNYSGGYSHTQIKTRNATCNDPWPPSGKEMFELSQLSYRQYVHGPIILSGSDLRYRGDFIDIMEVIDKRLNDKGKNWRHVFKSLVVLDYLLHSGSENVILYCEENIYVIKTLREFQYIDDDGRDQGANVRQKAKDITNLLLDRRRLTQERTARARMRDRMLGRPSTDTEDDDDDLPPYRRPVARPSAPNGNDRQRARQNDEEENLRKAIEESKKSANALATAEERDVQRAIELSKEEEERRKRLVALAERGVFDDTDFVGLTAPLIDLDGPAQTNTIQPQFTSVQPQYTAVQPQYTSVQPQYTSYNPYLQQAQQEAMQQEYARQQAEFTRQQMEAQSAMAAQQAQLLLQQQQQQQRPLVPQPTAFGSNNPFIASPPPSPTIPERPITSPPRDAPVPFTLTGTYDGRRPTAARNSDTERQDRAPIRPYSTGAEPRRRSTGTGPGADEENEKLANLFAGYTGDGVDTFGNVGQLRFGGTEFGRLVVQKTGVAAQSAGGRGERDEPVLEREGAEKICA
ncbi:ENTH-domain-containing protein [Ganoderma leucocontextum]|nr:ENTH-domain-containing protein [Ganoderma leucocontextum]